MKCVAPENICTPHGRDLPYDLPTPLEIPIYTALNFWIFRPSLLPRISNPFSGGVCIFCRTTQCHYLCMHCLPFFIAWWCTHPISVLKCWVSSCTYELKFTNDQSNYFNPNIITSACILCHIIIVWWCTHLISFFCCWIMLS